ncbi:MerR family transcriptional regulator [Streptomyces sp. NPDC051310]|uniref:DNA polymerase III subunit beta family protein n=1 Tax=Streptomyces sp. NPDC051310 TaxID=3365649 RepID=UPI00379DD64D
MDDTDSPSEDTAGLLGIGAFARRVGLAPSALRFYDDCGVLHPAYVDDTTGYRYYAPDQERRASLVRRLREAGVPLTDASVVLDGPRDEARAVLEAHARTARETAAAARSALQEVLDELAGGPRATAARVGGAELASAVRQVAPAAAGAAVREEFPALGCVLLELDGPEVRLVATDRYRLAVRTLRSRAGEGRPRHVLVDAREMREAAAWAVLRPEVTIEADGQGARLRSASAARELPDLAGAFPEYRMILEGLPVPRARLIADRTALRTAIAEDVRSGPVALHSDGRHLTLSAPGLAERPQPALCTGQPLRVSFDPEVLLPALDAGVGPDVLLEISEPAQPVVVRSADQGSFTTLVMPVRHTAEQQR